MNNIKWISNKNLPFMMYDFTDAVNGSLYFRRSFNASEEIKKAELNICTLGLGVCYINGKAVTEDVLSTPYTAYDKRVLYNAYDVTKLLKKGENAIGVHVGNGFYNNNSTTWNDMMAPWRSTPKLAVELCIEFVSGRIEKICSDEQWKTKEGPCVYNHMRQGEKYDANLEINGFGEARFNDEIWDNVVIVHAPGGIMEKNCCPPIRVCKRIKPISKKGNLYDFGESISGWVHIKLSGEKGQAVSIKYDEAFDENGELLGDISMFMNNPIMMRNEDVFICSGNKNEEYRPQFCYHGFRYVKIDNAPNDIEVTAEFIHTDFDVVGEFWTDNELINKIHEMSIRSILSNYVGIPTDCPHREQNGWTGDALCSCDQTLMNFDVNKSYYKWLNDFKDAQRPNGQLPGIIPSAGWGYNWGSGPAWDSALILIPYKTYIITGDKSLMENMWDNMVLYMNYMEYMERNDGTICYGLGDWCPPNKNNMCPTEITDTAFYYYDLKAMSYMADILNKDKAIWEEKSIRIKKAWRDSFLNKPEYNVYQTYYAVAIYFGLLEEDEISIYAKKLAELVKNNGYHIDCGILGTKAIFDALSDNGYADILYKMVVNPTEPSYAWWVKNGMTTLCENWNLQGSRNHHMFSEVENWFYRHIAGIRFDIEGLTIKPSIIDEIQNFKAHHKNIYVERKGSTIYVKLDRNARIKLGKIDAEYNAGEYTFSLE